MPRHSLILSFLLSLHLLFATLNPFHRILVQAEGGQWELLQRSAGISAMHMQLLNNDRVVIFDRTGFGPSNISLTNSNCLNDDPTAPEPKLDCTAHSVEYDVLKNSVRPLTLLTNLFCSSGAVMPDGRFIQTGGWNDGERNVRVIPPCDGYCDWMEAQNALEKPRWYATNHILPDGRQIIIGGRWQFTYEFFPKGKDPNAYSLPFLFQTNDHNYENNLYPFVFLNVDSNLFIFANNRAILLDYRINKVIRTYPTVPGGDPRSFPSTGSAVLLPLKNLQASSLEAEVLVCGGAPKGSYAQAVAGNFVRALDTCARMKITDQNPQWVMETMPRPRVMGDMTLLPDGNVLIINGAGAGAASWENGRNPVLNPVLYRPDNPLGSRFELQNPSKRPRMYHSSAILLRNGRVLVGGSNPYPYDNFTAAALFPTDMSLEAFSPSYMDKKFDNLRPKIISPASKSSIGYGKNIVIRFQVTGKMSANMVSVTMVAPPLTTHSFSMNQRLLVLGGGTATNVGTSTYNVQVTTPSSAILAPSGYYMLFVVHQGIPSEGIWIRVI